MDGFQTGIKIATEGETKIKHRLFKTKKLAKIYAAKNDIKDYSLYIVYNLKDVTKAVKLDDCEKIDNNYVYYDPEIYEFFCFKEPEEEEVIELGYFIFENGDTVQNNLEYGVEHSKMYFDYIKETLYALLKYRISLCDKYSCKISKIHKLVNGHMVVSFINSTQKLHILFNRKLFQFNKKRKENGLRVLPFDKTVDKFLTIYVYLTKDPEEEIQDNYEDIFASIVEDINMCHSECNCRFVLVRYKGTIIIDGGDKV